MVRCVVTVPLLIPLHSDHLSSGDVVLLLAVAVLSHFFLDDSRLTKVWCWTVSRSCHQLVSADAGIRDAGFSGGEGISPIIAGFLVATS